MRDNAPYPPAPGPIGYLCRCEELKRYAEADGIPDAAIVPRMSPPDSLALGAVDDDELRGFGVIRRCAVGAKIGPLFADDAKTAEQLFKALARFVAGEAVSIDVPENNPLAVALAKRQGLHETFGCARMYLGPMPDMPARRIFGVTSFELG